jgi:hypothetical protein
MALPIRLWRERRLAASSSAETATDQSIRLLRCRCWAVRTRFLWRLENLVNTQAKLLIHLNDAVVVVTVSPIYKRFAMIMAFRGP